MLLDWVVREFGEGVWWFVWEGLGERLGGEEFGMGKVKKVVMVLLWEELEFWEVEVRVGVERGKGLFVFGGEMVLLVDFVLWLVLYDIVRVCGEWVFVVSFGSKGKIIEEGEEEVR